MRRLDAALTTDTLGAALGPPLDATDAARLRSENEGGREGERGRLPALFLCVSLCAHLRQ